MGAQWKHAGRIQNSSKRGALFGKLVKEIIVAAKLGDAVLENNARLRAAVEAARKASVPRDTIERAIKKGAGVSADSVNYETVLYEGFAPHQVPVIVECLTDNKNRTAADLRLLFRKGHLGSMGSVLWMFDQKANVEASLKKSEVEIDLEAVAIEIGAQEVELLQSSDAEIIAVFIGDRGDLDIMSQTLTSLGWNLSSSELNYLPKNKIILEESQKKEVVNFLTDIDEHDDVHRLYAGLEI